jgi:FSR family fosmidomycin resistance protein-like MFS transporter
VHVVAPPVDGRSKAVSVTRVAIIVALLHGLNDAYASFVPPLLPRIMDDMGLSIAMATTLAVTFSIAASLPQPFFGYLADRYGRRVFAVAGPLVSAIFIASIGLASTFWVLVLLLMLGGLGSAAFHPPGASYAVRVSEGKGGGARYSVFSFGGSLGFAAGPLIAVGLVQWRGMEGLWLAMLPALVLAPVFFLGLPSGRAEARAVEAPPRPAEVLRLLVGPLGLIFGISATMAFVQRTFLTMEPIIVAELGGSETLGAVTLALYLGAAAFGTVAGGVLADHVDRRLLLAHLCFWSLPAHLVAVWVGPQGGWGLFAVAVAGFFGMATLPPIVVMAQEILPRGAAVSSGIVMGLAWAAGSFFVLGTGILADAIGPQPATLLSMPLVLLAVALALHPALKSPPPASGAGGAD